MKVAVLGSGASAWAAVQGVRLAQPEAEIRLFDDSATLPEPDLPADGNPQEVEAFYRKIYKEFREANGLKFPPVKNNFGTVPERLKLNDSNRFMSQPIAGGLTNLWGGTCLPLLPHEWEGCPTNHEAMMPWYRRVVAEVGIAGAADPLDDLFSAELVNRPALDSIPAARRFQDAVNGNGDFRCGRNRIAIETRPEHERSCTYCGECMMGCYRKSIWSATKAWGDDLVFHSRGARVDRISGNRVIGQDNSTSETFDKILVAAGTYNTSRIVRRSFPDLEADELQDNAIFQFPILEMNARRAPGDLRRYNALSQLLLVHSGSADCPAAQIQIYPHFDTLFRAAVPAAVWPLVRGLQRMARGRVLWGRLYSSAADGHRYRFQKDGDALEISQAPRMNNVAPVLHALRRQLSGSGFWIPPVKPICSKTSSHLSGPFSWQHESVDDWGKIAPDVHIVDGTLLPASPVTSPTLALMANAMRISHEVCA